MENRPDEKESKSYKLDSAESNQVYYNEYKRLFEHSVILSKHVRQTIKRQQALFRHLDQLNVRAHDFKDFQGVCKKDSKRKSRRGNLQMQKNHECPSSHCSHRYGSQSSLKIHIKHKHPELYEGKRKSKSEEIHSSNQIQSSIFQKQ